AGREIPVPRVGELARRIASERQARRRSVDETVGRHHDSRRLRYRPYCVPEPARAQSKAGPVRRRNRFELVRAVQLLWFRADSRITAQSISPLDPCTNVGVALSEFG